MRAPWLRQELAQPVPEARLERPLPREPAFPLPGREAWLERTLLQVQERPGERALPRAEAFPLLGQAPLLPSRVQATHRPQTRARIN